MKGSLLAVAAVTALATCTNALHYVKRDNPRAIHMSVERREPSPETKEAVRLRRRRSRLAKRQKTVAETLDNYEDGSLYFANVTMGTPPQNFRFHVDTGSSDLWANSASSSFCQQSASTLENEGDIPCSVSGTYNANSSSTYKYVNSDFLISYADTTGAQGDYATDTLRFGTTAVTGQQFGIGYQSNSSEGVMGIGYPSLEVAAQYDSQQPYANIPQNMAQLGLINTPAYSLWLDDLNSATGNILFGGVDTAKFTGSLTTVPILQESGQYVEMVVALSGISVLNNGKNTSVSTQALPALLDSGSTLMYLPQDVSQSIFSAVGAQYSERDGVALCPCSLANNNAITLDLIFSGQVISVSMSQLVLQQGTGSTCVFGVVPQDGEPYTLGDTFIRNAYIVYDINANTISLAQTNFNAGSNSDVKEIQSGASGVPAATGAANAQTLAVTGTGSVYAGGIHTTVAQTNSVNYAAKPTPAPGMKVWGAAAAGVVGAIAAL